MKKFIAILFLSLFTIIQIGTVGVSLYQTKCLKNNLTSYSFKNKGCCCKKGNKAVSTPKSCCSSKEQSCCTTSSCDKDVVKDKCCDSQSIQYKIPVSPYESLIDLESQKVKVLSKNTHIRPNFQIQFSSKLKEGHFIPPHPPPIINIDRRILLQSFQI